MKAEVKKEFRKPKFEPFDLVIRVEDIDDLLALWHNFNKDNDDFYFYNSTDDDSPAIVPTANTSKSIYDVLEKIDSELEKYITNRK